MDKNEGRYAVSSDEDYEPGSDDTVLKNNFGITLKDEIEEIEGQELSRVENELIDLFDEGHRFTAKDICSMHKMWLGELYPSAGKYRSVSIKGGFLFAAPEQIEKWMYQLEKNYLQKYTPCHIKNSDNLAEALGIVHVELIIIHPFREGNGRTSRLLADLMAIQSGRAPLDYSTIDSIENKEGYDNYILAIHAGFNDDYQLIKDIFKNLLNENK